ncbi:hypothetical protein HWV62_13427 [Athelia sp. TMB]|nr:hypothetical protein HWV62_13427 [Athelia sp. TMB]
MAPERALLLKLSAGCPMECYMAGSAGSWSCTIELRMPYDNKGKLLSGAPRRVPFGPRLTEKGQFELTLRRAQAAILNPHLPVDTFLPMTVEELKAHQNQDPQTLGFSKNTVSVNIEDPEATDLVFADLPGLIQNAALEEIELVRDLAISYMNRPESIILIAIPMNDDIQNQQAVLLARGADPDGERTIGVLTKPDIIGGSTARDNWVKVLQGKEHVLKHGYYCVRLPDDDERRRNLSRASSQQASMDFFQRTLPWAQITGADRRRLGIPGFISDVSRLLISMTERALPKLKGEIERLIAGCAEGLAALPPPITDTQTEILGRIRTFCDEVTAAVTGKGEDKALVQANRKRYSDFEREICRTQPNFVTGPPVYEGSNLSLSALPEVNLQEVRRVIADSVAWELPHIVPPEAMQTLIKRSVSHWNEPSLRCFIDVFLSLGEFFETLANAHFGRFKKMQSHLMTVIQADLAKLKGVCYANVEESVRKEQGPFFAPHVGDYDAARGEWLDEYKRQRHARSSEISYPRADAGRGHDYHNEAQVLSGLAALGYHGINRSDLVRLRPKDEYEDELIVMADVRAYFEVAYKVSNTKLICDTNLTIEFDPKRIIHSVPMTIEASLVRPLARDLHASLVQSLFTRDNAAAQIKELLGEDPTISRRRDELIKKKKQLEEIRDRVDEFALGL